MKRAKNIDARRQRCRNKFLAYFPDGYRDDTYIDWERDYKWQAHLEWKTELSRSRYQALLRAGKFDLIAATATRIEGRTNLLFSFEKMALRDAVRSKAGAEVFARGLFEYVYGKGTLRARFEAFTDVVAELPRRQTRVLTWPLHTVFGMIATPRTHIFLKPRVTQIAAEAYGFDFEYKPRPNWRTYKSLLDFAAQVRRDTSDLGPRDMIDLQSFIWVQGSDEYPNRRPTRSAA